MSASSSIFQKTDLLAKRLNLLKYIMIDILCLKIEVIFKYNSKIMFCHIHGHDIKKDLERN